MKSFKSNKPDIIPSFSLLKFLYKYFDKRLVNPLDNTHELMNTVGYIIFLI